MFFPGVDVHLPSKSVIDGYNNLDFEFGDPRVLAVCLYEYHRSQMYWFDYTSKSFLRCYQAFVETILLGQVTTTTSEEGSTIYYVEHPSVDCWVRSTQHRQHPMAVVNVDIPYDDGDTCYLGSAAGDVSLDFDPEIISISSDEEIQAESEEDEEEDPMFRFIRKGLDLE